MSERDLRSAAIPRPFCGGRGDPDADVDLAVVELGHDQTDPGAFLDAATSHGLLVVDPVGGSDLGIGSPAGAPEPSPALP